MVYNTAPLIHKTIAHSRENIMLYVKQSKPIQDIYPNYLEDDLILPNAVIPNLPSLSFSLFLFAIKLLYTLKNW